MKLRVAMKVVKSFFKAGRAMHRAPTIRHAFQRLDKAWGEPDDRRTRMVLDWYCKIFDPPVATTSETGKG